MKAQKIYLIILASVVFLSISCKKIIDLKPETIIENDGVINTVQDLQKVLNGAYDGLQSENVLGGNMVFYSDLLADDAELRNLNKLQGFGTNEIYYGNTSVQIIALRDMWRDGYSAINKANNVINFIDNNTKLSGSEFESAKDTIKAQAMFIRAVTHFELLRFWALPYDVDKQGSNTQPGVVIRTKPTLSIDSLDTYKKPRSTVEEVYAFVIDELTKADAQFAAKGAYSSVGFASSMACKAMLARVYYYKGDNDNAINYARQVVLSGLYELKTTTQLSSSYNNRGIYKPGVKGENIFEIINTPLDNKSGLPNNYSRALDYWFRVPLSLAQQLYNDSLDYRRKQFLTVTQNASQVITGAAFCNKYTIPNGTIGGANINYLRLPEMHLIIAECSAIKGDLSTALQQYNNIRRRGFVNYVAETSTSNLLEKIQYERRIEMNFEGDRYMFLRKNKLPLRLGTKDEYQKFLFKIPQEEIAGNADIVQN